LHLVFACATVHRGFPSPTRMARLPRLVVPDYPHHVLQRGHNRQPCFLSDADRRYYLEQLTSEAGPAGCAIHAYVLMTNHLHLLVTPSRQDSLSRLMRAVNLRFTRRVNARLGRTGTLWESRFKSIVIEADEYLLTCHRYIELNPVRAGMVRDPGSHRWSSHAANAGEGIDLLVTPHSLYLDLGGCEFSRKREYRRLFEWGLSNVDTHAIRSATARGRPLGNDGFLEELAVRTGRDVVPRQHGGLRSGAGRPGTRARHRMSEFK